MKRTLLIPMSILITSCTAPQTIPPDSTPQTAVPAAAAPMVGVVRVVGSAPVNVQVVLQPDSGRGVVLTGPLRRELERLAGAEVAVRGEIRAEPGTMEGRAVEVASYVVRSVDGQPVVLGTVEGMTGEYVRLRTETGELVYLANAPKEFAPGQKVWVQGRRGVIVQSYGTIRP